MSALPAIRSLRLSQGIFTAVNLGLASYLVHEMTDMASSVTVALVAACISAIGMYCASSATNITSTKPSNLFYAFGVDWTVSFVSMVALISLGLSVTDLSLCRDKTYTVAKLHTALTGFNFSNWAATATYIAVQISKRGTRGIESVPEKGVIRI